MPRRRSWISTVPQESVEMVDVDCLAWMAERIHQAQLDLAELVEIARWKGITWEDIAGSIGVTRSAAWQRYAKQDSSTWEPFGLRDEVLPFGWVDVTSQVEWVQRPAALPPTPAPRGSVRRRPGPGGQARSTA